MVNGLIASRGWQLGLVLMTLSVVGCSEPSDRVSVHGRVTYQSQPITNAALTFFPESGRPIGAAVVDGEYRAELPPGQYQVTINLGTTLPEGWKEGDPLPPPPFELATQYTQRARTELLATVAEGQEEPINFDLK